MQLSKVVKFAVEDIKGFYKRMANKIISGARCNLRLQTKTFENWDNVDFVDGTVFVLK